MEELTLTTSSVSSIDWPAVGRGMLRFISVVRALPYDIKA